MGKVICKCGQQVRTTGKPGTQLECPRCENILVVTEKTLDHTDRLHEPLVEPLVRPITHARGDAPRRITTEDTAPETAETQSVNAKPAFPALLLAISFLVLALILIAFVFSGGLGNGRDTTSLKTDPNQQPVEAPKNWSRVSWEKDFSKFPKGNQIRSFAQRIAVSGSAMDPSKFWELLDNSSFQSRVLSPRGSLRAYQEKLPINKIVDKLKAFPIDAISSPANTTASDWEIIGISQDRQSVAVLIRYFHEPLNLSELVNSASWVQSLNEKMTVDEYLNVAKDLYAARSMGSSTADSSMIDRQSIFTPLFGYLVLLFDTTSDRAAWSDAIGIPSQVNLSRASGTIYEEDWIAFKKQTEVAPKEVPLGWTQEDTIDVFGEYKSNDQESFAKTLVFAENRPDAETAIRLEQASQKISPERSRLLVDVAQAVTSNYGEIKQRVSQFRTAFPDDCGIDALLISLWLKFFSSNRSGMVFDDFGSVFVDAADRLHSKTGDKLLLEIKSRIYASHGRIEESDKQLDLAENAGKKSAYLFRRRIDQAIEKNDKVGLMKQLSQFSNFWIGQPDVSLQADSKQVSRKLTRMWQESTSKRSNDN